MENDDKRTEIDDVEEEYRSALFWLLVIVLCLSFLTVIGW